MNPTQLAYFISVCDCGSISEAARKHKVSQPCITSAIRELNQEYNITLFNYYKNHLTLTWEGQILLEYARPLCSALEHVGELFADKTKKHAIRIGIPGRLSGVLSPVLFYRFRKSYPQIELDFFEYPSAYIAEAILVKKLDFGIVILKSDIEKLLNSFEFCELKMKLCVNKANRLAEIEREISPEDIGEQPIISLQGGDFRNDFFAARMREHGIEPNILLRTNQVVTMIEFIRRDLAVGFLFSENVAAYPEIICLDTSWQQPAAVGVVWSGKKKMSREEIIFADYLRSFPWR